MFKNAESVKVLARRFGIGQWSFIGPGSENKVYSFENSPQGAWDNIAEQILLEFAESGHPIFPCNDSIVQGCSQKQRARKNCLYTSLQIKTQLIQFIALFFLSISSVSTEQWQLIAKNFEDHQDRTGELVILMGQSIVLGQSQGRSSFAKRKSHERSNYLAAVHPKS